MVAADVGSTDDPQALAFWQSSDVLGFSDYQRLFMFLEHGDAAEQEAGELRELCMCHHSVPKAQSAHKAVEQAKELAARFGPQWG